MLWLNEKPSAVATTDEPDASSIQVSFAATTEGRMGGFRLEYTWYSTTTSYCIGYDAEPSDGTYSSVYDATVEKRIELMISQQVGNHDVSVVKATTAGGHRYTVTFESPTGINPRALVMIPTDADCDNFVATPYFVIDKDGDGLGSYPTNYFTLSFDTSSSVFGNASFCAMCTLGHGKYTTVNNEGYIFYVTFGFSLDASSSSLGDVPLLELVADTMGGISTSDYTSS